MISIARILCPTDFSDASRRALAEAVTLARWYEAELTVLHAAPLLVLPPVELAYIPSTALGPEARQRLLGELRAFVEPVRRAAPAVRIELVEGDPVTEILSRAQGGETDLVVLGTHGRQGLPRWVLGSVTEKVLRRAPCPVLTVAPSATAAPSARFETVLCPVDFSPSSPHTVREAAALAEEAQARLVLLHVIEGSIYPPMRVPPGFDRAAYRDEVTAAVSGRLWRLLPDGRGGAEVAVVWGTPHREILRQAVDRRAGLIVMGAHGGALDSTVFGSTAHRVVRDATAPVLVLRAHTHGFEERTPELVGVRDGLE